MPKEMQCPPNEFLVSSAGEHVVIQRLPAGRLSRERALSLAAWIVAVADHDQRFAEILRAVENS